MEKFLSESQQSRDTGQERVVSQFEGDQAGTMRSNLGEGQPFAVGRLPTDWIRPAHIREGILLYSS
jgi:hypothetical protein